MTDWGKIGGDLYDGAGKLFDGGKKLVGEGIDKGTDVVGSGLEKVGADEWADTVEDWGDETASSLGAEVGEQQLGQSEEANELIHGKPEKITATVKNLRDFQKAFDLVGSGMKKLDAGHWKGEGADAFRAKFAPLPTDWLRAADAFEAAAKTLETYATAVTTAQARAGEAIALYREGNEASKSAAAAFNKKADAYNAARTSEAPFPTPVSSPIRAWPCAGVRGRSSTTPGGDVTRPARRRRARSARRWHTHRKSRPVLTGRCTRSSTTDSARASSWPTSVAASSKAPQVWRTSSAPSIPWTRTT